MSSGIGVDTALPGFLHRRLCGNAPASVIGPAPPLILESELGLLFNPRRSTFPGAPCFSARVRTGLGGGQLVTEHEEQGCALRPEPASPVSRLKEETEMLPWLQQPLGELHMSGRPSMDPGQCPDLLFQFPRACSGMVRLGNSQALNRPERLPLCCGNHAEGHHYPQPLLGPGTRPTLTSRHSTVRCLTGSLYSGAFSR